MNHAMHWRPLTTLDLPIVEAIAAQVHPRFPEDIQIMAERQRLYPDGARLFELDGVASGYIISHPWRFRSVPALNTSLGTIPADADTYYVHDLALLDAARGTGAAAMIVGDILRHARSIGLITMSLVAVNNSASFWHKHGLRPLAAPELAGKLASYEATACYMSRVV